MTKEKTTPMPNKQNNIIPQMKEEFKRHTNVLMEEMKSTVKTVTEQHSQVIGKIDGLRGDVDELKSDMAIVKPAVEKLARDQKEMQSDIKGIKSELGEVKSELHSVEAVVTENSRDIKLLKGDIKELKADVKDIKEGQDEIRHLTQDHEQRLHNLKTA